MAEGRPWVSQPTPPNSEQRRMPVPVGEGKGDSGDRSGAEESRGSMQRDYAPPLHLTPHRPGRVTPPIASPPPSPPAHTPGFVSTLSRSTFSGGGLLLLRSGSGAVKCSRHSSGASTRVASAGEEGGAGGGKAAGGQRGGRGPTDGA